MINHCKARDQAHFSEETYLIKGQGIIKGQIQEMVVGVSQEVSNSGEKSRDECFN